VLLLIIQIMFVDSVGCCACFFGVFEGEERLTIWREKDRSLFPHSKRRSANKQRHIHPTTPTHVGMTANQCHIMDGSAAERAISHPIFFSFEFHS
jgi:hypothetical protein